jgi:hypothetical protein
MSGFRLMYPVLCGFVLHVANTTTKDKKVDEDLICADIVLKIQISADFWRLIGDYPELSDLWALPDIYSFYGLYDIS